MSQATAPAPETAAGAETDVVDALDLDTIDESVDTNALPEEMIVGRDTPGTDPKDATDRGDGRTPKGRFAKKGEEATETDPEAGETQDAANADPNAQPAAAAAAKPFQYRALGQTHALDGSTLNDDGSVTIKAESVSQLREAMNARHAIAADSQFADRARAEVAKRDARIQELEQNGTVETAKSGALVTALTKVLQEPDDARALDQFFALRSEFPQLLAKAEADFWKSRATRPAAERSDARTEDRSDTTQRQPAGLPTREIAADTTREYVEHLKLDHQFRDLRAEDWKQLGERFDRTPYAFLRPATAEEAKQYGVAAGTVVFDTDAFQADVMEYVGGLRKSRETAASKAKLAADNARRTAPRVNAPPAPSGGPAPKGERRAITSEKDLEEWLNSDEL